ncbi:hypothetical protein PSY76_23280, partial [Shigella flexneri]|nr:hypothetical protein [Shigella flexneri]
HCIQLGFIGPHCMEYTAFKHAAWNPLHSIEISQIRYRVISIERSVFHAVRPNESQLNAVDSMQHGGMDVY